MQCSMIEHNSAKLNCQVKLLGSFFFNFIVIKNYFLKTIKIKKTTFLNDAKSKIINFCSYQERCHKEVIDKLIKLNLSKNEIDKIIVYLIENNYLNENRFAKVFAGGKFRIKKWGKIRIIRELKHRKISDYNIKLALEEISHDDYIKLFNIISTKKLESIKNLDALEKKKKLLNFLTYKGWEKEMIYDKLNSF